MYYWDAKRKQNFGHLVKVNEVKQLKYWKVMPMVHWVINFMTSS